MQNDGGHAFAACLSWCRGMISLALILALLLARAPGTAASFVYDHSLTDPERYDRCLKLAYQDSGAAYEQALAWHDAGGGAAAVHCSAVALFEGKHYPEAAFKLDQLAREHDAGDAGLRAQILDQAGNAWLLAGEPQKAEDSISAAMSLGDRSADTYADRARAKALRKDWSGAESDLNDALAKDTYRADLLVLRASARHALGQMKEARADLDRAIEIDPDYADALVERGAMKLEAGDQRGARADWLAVLVTQPKGPAADTARARLEALDVNGRAQPPATRH